jgi:predicted ester cyclase
MLSRAVFALVTGTNRSELMGKPPTGKSINMAAIKICRVSGAKTGEQWVVADNAAMLRQLGIVG